METQFGRVVFDESWKASVAIDYALYKKISETKYLFCVLDNRSMMEKISPKNLPKFRTGVNRLGTIPSDWKEVEIDISSNLNDRVFMDDMTESKKEVYGDNAVVTPIEIAEYLYCTL